jgi:hypothetical protein
MCLIRGRCPTTNVVKKHSISSELAQKMVDAAEAKAGEIGEAIGLSGAPTVQNAVAAAASHQNWDQGHD